MTRKLNRRAAVAAAIGALALGWSAASAQEYTARIGHLESDQQSRHVFLTKVAEMVNERTGGAVELQLFPQGQLGNQRVMTEGVQLGTIEGTVSPAAFLGGFNPAVSILDIPYLMPADPAEAQALREGPFGEALLDTFDDRGVVGVAWWPNGTKNLTSNKSLDDLSDMSEHKFRVMDSKILIEQFNAVGASAVALPFGELYTSLQTGVVDGQENPLDTIQRMKFDEVQDYLVITEHGAMEDIVLFNPTWWNSLPEEYQAIIENSFNEVVPELLEHKAAAIETALTAISGNEINVRVASDDERAGLAGTMKAPATAAYLEIAGEEGQALIDTYAAETGS